MHAMTTGTVLMLAGMMAIECFRASFAQYTTHVLLEVPWNEASHISLGTI